jgi:hypothetical protein
LLFNNLFIVISFHYFNNKGGINTMCIHARNKAQRTHFVPSWKLVVMVLAGLVLQGCATGGYISTPGESPLVGIEEARRLHENVTPVTIRFSHDTSGDKVLAKGKVEAIGTGYRLLQGDVAVTGDIEGEQFLLSDTQTVNPPTVHVDASITISGVLQQTGERVEMLGRMALEIDTTQSPPLMTGYQVFRTDVGTHTGYFALEGTVTTNAEGTRIGSGTATGWIAPNDTGS